jgi:hypothetical protein
MTTQYDTYNIFITGSAFSGSAGADYEQSVKWHLDLIRRSHSGRALISAIQRTGKPVTILPFTPTVKDPFNAYATTTIFGHFEIFYSPPMWGYGGAAASQFPPGNPGNSPSAILFHEMAHTYREMRGTFNAQRTMQKGYDNQEEFFAVLMSNIFVTDSTALLPVRTLRADHHDFKPLAAAQATSQGFLEVSENRLLVAQFWGQEFDLMTDLLHVNSSFNPIQQYYTLKFPTFTP